MGAVAVYTVYEGVVLQLSSPGTIRTRASSDSGAVEQMAFSYTAVIDRFGDTALPSSSVMQERRADN